MKSDFFQFSTTIRKSILVLCATSATLSFGSCKESSEYKNTNPEIASLVKQIPEDKDQCKSIRSKYYKALNNKDLNLSENRNFLLKTIESFEPTDVDRKQMIALLKKTKNFSVSDAGNTMAFFALGDCKIEHYFPIKHYLTHADKNSEDYNRIKKVLHKQYLSNEYPSALEIVTARTLIENFELAKNPQSMKRIKELKKELGDLIAPWTFLGEKQENGTLTASELNRFRLQTIEEFETMARYKNEITGLVDWNTK